MYQFALVLSDPRSMYDFCYLNFRLTKQSCVPIRSSCHCQCSPSIWSDHDICSSISAARVKSAIKCNSRSVHHAGDKAERLGPSSAVSKKSDLCCDIRKNTLDCKGTQCRVQAPVTRMTVGRIRYRASCKEVNSILFAQIGQEIN